MNQDYYKFITFHFYYHNYPLYISINLHHISYLCYTHKYPLLTNNIYCQIYNVNQNSRSHVFIFFYIVFLHLIFICLLSKMYIKWPIIIMYFIIHITKLCLKSLILF